MDFVPTGIKGHGTDRKDTKGKVLYCCICNNYFCCSCIGVSGGGVGGEVVQRKGKAKGKREGRMPSKQNPERLHQEKAARKNAEQCRARRQSGRPQRSIDLLL